MLALIWEIYARYLDNQLLFPTLTATVDALSGGHGERRSARRVWYSLKVLLMGYAIRLSRSRRC